MSVLSQDRKGTETLSITNFNNNNNNNNNKNNLVVRKCFTPFTSSNSIARSGAFHSLLGKIWREKKDDIGKGEVVWEMVREVVGGDGGDHHDNLPNLLLSCLLPLLNSPQTYDKPCLIFLLSLLSEASNNPTFLPLLLPSLSLFLSLLEEAH